MSARIEASGLRFELQNSIVTIEDGPAGALARIEHRRRRRVEYAGPLPSGTVDALAEVADGE